MNNKPTFLDAPRVLSFGGGVNSVALLLRLIEDNNPPDLVVFADTGDESPQTTAAVEHTVALCRGQGIKFQSVRNGDLVQWFIENKVLPLPHRNIRSCTEKFKVAPIRAWLREQGINKARMLVGFAKDEAHRMKDSNVQWIRNEWPLIYDYGMTRADCQKTIARLWDGPPVPKSGCQGCPFIGERGFLQLARSDRAAFRRWRVLEEQARDYPKNRLYAEGLTLAQIEHRADTETRLDAFGDLGGAIEGDCMSEAGCMT
jgi:hypothetical protein